MHPGHTSQRLGERLPGKRSKSLNFLVIAFPRQQVGYSLMNPGPECLMTTPRQAVAQIVDTAQPCRLLVCGKLAEEIGEHWKEHNKAAHITILSTATLGNAFPLSNSQDLALITGVLEHLPRDEGKLLLGQLRNYGTHQIAVVVEPDRGWSFKDFIALGFRHQADLTSDGNEARLYTYNIDSYNHKRAWNNPDNWANPEMWDKAWW